MGFFGWCTGGCWVTQALVKDKNHILWHYKNSTASAPSFFRVGNRDGSFEALCAGNRRLLFSPQHSVADTALGSSSSHCRTMVSISLPFLFFFYCVGLCIVLVM
jgi:hypothetical protein